MTAAYALDYKTGQRQGKKEPEQECKKTSPMHREPGEPERPERPKLMIVRSRGRNARNW